MGAERSGLHAWEQSKDSMYASGYLSGEKVISVGFRPQEEQFTREDTSRLNRLLTQLGFRALNFRHVEFVQLSALPGFDCDGTPAVDCTGQQSQYVKVEPSTLPVDIERAGIVPHLYVTFRGSGERGVPRIVEIKPEETVEQVQIASPGQEYVGKHRAPAWRNLS